MAKKKSRVITAAPAEMREALMAESVARLKGGASEVTHPSLDELDKATKVFRLMKGGLGAFSGGRFSAAGADFAAAIERLESLSLDRVQTVAVVKAYMARSLWCADPAQEEVRCRAVACYEQALKTWRQSGQWKLLVEHLGILAAMQFVSGKPQEAIACLKQAAEVMNLQSASFEVSRIAECFYDYCRHLVLSGEWELAQENLENALVLTSVSGSDETGRFVDRPAPESFKLYELLALIAEHKVQELRQQSLALKAALS